MEQWLYHSDSGNTNISLTDSFGIETPPPVTKFLSLPKYSLTAYGSAYQSGDKFQTSTFRCKIENHSISLFLRGVDEVSALWDITQIILVVVYRRFGVDYRSHLQESKLS